ncbi:MAG TPA: Hsp70 family protein [Pseudonocardiaceae bacterium]|nr:Hsp70 family protein [Pseudonocardiaceae bacterium]
MTYALGIDVGTSYTAAAVCRLDGQQQNTAEVVPLGNRTASVASVLFLGADRSIVVGEAAQRRALTDPDRIVREFKRRIGDDTPLFVGGEPHAAHDLAARLVRWVVDRVAEREGGPADRIAITHPAGWGPYKKDLVRSALSRVGLTNLTFLAEPEAAAISYAALERVEMGTTVAVYDLGGGTFDAAVVRKADSGSFALLGAAEGLDKLGGADFDEAVFAHVQATFRAEFDALDVEDPDMLTALARLRRECTEAKEALSADTEVSIPVLLPGLSSHVRLGRSEFEEMIRPALQDTVESLSRALRSAQVTSQDLGAVLLVGGSSRIPLVSQLVSAALGCPVVVDADPKTTIALGAARSLVPAPAPPVAAPVPAAAVPATAAMPLPAVVSQERESPVPNREVPDRPPVAAAEREFSQRRVPAEDGQRRKLLAGLVLTAATIILVAGALLIPSVARLVDSRPTVADGSPNTRPDNPSGAPATAEDPAKISVAGAFNSSRGRGGALGDETTSTAPGHRAEPVGAATPGRTTTPAPAAQPAGSTTQPSAPRPTTEPTKPTTEPTQPTTEPTQPTTEPTQPTTEPTQPTTEPTQPITEPTQPPTEPAQSPTEPAEAP